MTDFYNSQLFATTVGALIGFLPAYWIGVLQEKKKEKKEYQAWLIGLTSELQHIQNCICEIKSTLETGNISTKRMNSDFLERARLVIFSLESDTRFLENLTATYRDIVHTNDMLDRYEKKTENRILMQPNVLSSMTGVSNSVATLAILIQTKITIMKPSLPSSLFWLRVALLIAVSTTAILIAASKDEVSKSAASVPIAIWPVNPDHFQDDAVKNMARAVTENTQRVSVLISESEGQKAIDRLLKHPWLFWFVLLTPLLTALLMAGERISAEFKK